MNKRKLTIILISLFSLIILVGALYLLNSKFHLLADIIEGPYTIFQTENYSQVAGDTQSATDEIVKFGSTISTFAAQGQTEDVSFSVRPNVDLGEVQLTVSDLKMGDKIIPKENIEVLNLKIWDQCTVDGKCNTTSAGRSPTSELLVSNNEQNLVADEKTANPNLANNKYIPPAIDKTFKATLTAGKTQTFYLRIHVPSDAMSGDYVSSVQFVPGQDILGQTFKLALKVMPFSLPDSSKDIGSYSSYRVDDTFQAGFQSIGKDNYLKYLTFLRQTGFTTLYVSDYGNVGWVAEQAKKLGFSRFIWRAVPYPEFPTSDPWNGWMLPGKLDDIKTKIGQIKNAGFSDVYIYGPDEIANTQKLVANMYFAKAIHGIGGKIAAAIPKQVFDLYNSDQLANFDSSISKQEAKIDLPIYKAATSKTTIFDNLINYYFNQSWWFTLANILGPNSTQAFDVPKFLPFVAGQPVSTDQDGRKNSDGSSKKYMKSLSQGVWHHIAGVWDGQTSQYKLYVDNQVSSDFDYTFPTVTPFGNKILKNTNRTLIGGYVDDAKTRLGIASFHGEISRVKVYNKALTKEQIDKSGTAEENSLTPAPTADFDFSNQQLANKVTNQVCIMGAGSQAPAWISDSPFGAGKKSLNFDNGYRGTSNAGAKGPYLDCGPTQNNFNIDNAMTVEAWVKLPDVGQGNFTNVNVGSIIGQTEGTETTFNPLENYIFGLINKTQTKNSLPEYYYNQSWLDTLNGSLYRGISGFYLQASELDGYLPYAIDSAFRGEGLFYDDFDTATKNEASTYPAANGDIVLTRQFEAFRAGIDDSRYMTLYNDLLDKLKAKDQTKTTEIDDPVQAMLNEYPFDINTQRSFIDTDGKQTTQPNSFHQANRKLVADKIVQMQSLLVDAPIISSINISENQVITTNPYIISVQAKDAAETLKISKVEFFVDNTLISTATLPDVSGTYQAVWDTSKYHSTVKVIVYNTDGTTEEITRSTTVNLPQNYQSPIITVLPQTGESKDLIQSVLGL